MTTAAQFAANLAAFQTRLGSGALTTGDIATLSQGLSGAIANLTVPDGAGQADSSNALAAADWLAPLYNIGLGVEGSVVTTQQAFVPVTSFPGVDPSGATDSTAGIQSALTALAGTGSALYFPGNPAGGFYLVSAPLTVPSNSLVWGSPNAIIKSTIVTGGPGSFSQTVFIALAGGATTATTLAAAPAKGQTAMTLASAAGFVDTSIVLVSRPGAYNVAQQFRQMGAAAGAVITVDDPVEFGFQIGDSVTIRASVPTRIEMYGNGMRISGTGDQAFEFAAADRCIITGFNITRDFGSFSNEGGSFDVAGRDNTWDHVEVDGNSVTAVGLALESNVRSRWLACRAHHCTETGFWAAASARFELLGCSAWKCANGALIAEGGPAELDANQRYHVTDFHGYDCSSQGITISGGSDGQFENVICDYSVVGITMQASGAGIQPARTSFTNLQISDNSSYGLEQSSSGTDWQATNVTGDRCGGAAVQIAGTGHVEIRGLYCDDSAIAVNVGAAADVTIIGGHLRQVARAGWDGILNNAANVLTVEDVVFEKTGGTGTSICIDAAEVAGAVSRVRNCRTIGTLTYGIFTEAVANTVRVQVGNNFASCTNPTSFGAGTFRSRFTQVLAGAATTVVAWPDMRTTDNVELQVQAAGGTLEGPYGITPTPGTGFTITPLGATPALDTSTLQVLIT